MHTELGSSQVEVQRCTLSWAARRLRSQCTLSWEVGKELGEELARRKWRWKLMPQICPMPMPRCVLQTCMAPQGHLHLLRHNAAEAAHHTGEGLFDGRRFLLKCGCWVYTHGYKFKYIYIYICIYIYTKIHKYRYIQY